MLQSREHPAQNCSLKCSVTWPANFQNARFVQFRWKFMMEEGEKFGIGIVGIGISVELQSHSAEAALGEEQFGIGPETFH